MRCKDIEHLVIYSSREDLNPEKLSEMEQHISGCAKCARFSDDLRKIRLCLEEIPPFEPPPELARQTQLMCHAKLDTMHAAGRKNDVQALLMRIPKSIWIALFSLIALTIIWMFPFMKDFRIGQPLSFQTIVVLFLMIQNAAMLFFSPILIRKYRAKNQDLKPV